MPSVRLLLASFLAVLPAVQAGAVGITAIPPPPACTPTPKPAQPRKLHCGKLATLSNPQILDTPDASSAADCAAQCLANSNCVSFGYDGDNAVCLLLSASLNAQGWKKDSTSTVMYYNIRCWACPPKPYNGDFETGTIADWPVLAQFANGDDAVDWSVVSPGFDGSNYAGQLSTSQSADTIASAVIVVAQSVKTLPNTAYLLSFACNAEHPGQSPSALANFISRVTDEADMSLLATQTTLLTNGQTVDTAGHTLGTWNYIDLPFNSGNNNEVQIALELYTNPDNATVLLDNIVLTRLTYPPGTYVANGDFESGNLRPWSINLSQGSPSIDDVSVSLSSPGQDGDGMAVLLHASRQSSPFISATLLQQVAIPLQTYTFSFAYQWVESSESTGTNTLTVSIPTSRRSYYFQQQIAWDGSTTDSEGNSPGVWNVISGSFTSQDNAVTISLTNAPYENGSSRDVLIDNVVLAPSL